MSPERIVAVDALPIRRSHEIEPGRTISFLGHLAVALSLFGVEDFEVQYETLIDRLFREMGLARGRRVYSAYDLNKLLFARSRAYDSFLFRFARGLLGVPNLRVTAIVTAFDSSRLDQAATAEDPNSSLDSGAQALERARVPVYGTAPGRTYVSLGKFLGLIQNPFPALAAWKFCERSGVYNQTFLLDYFEGQTSRAWDELTSHNLVYLVPDGDSCSPFISAADLLLRALDRQLVRNQARLERDPVRSALLQIGSWEPTAELHVHQIGNAEIPTIAPYATTSIVSEAFVRHPILFVVNEETQPKERVEIENSPLMRSVADRAYTLRGSVMFYRPDKSSGLVRDGDYIVNYGPRGKETFRRLRKLGYQVKEWEAGGEGPDTGNPSP